MLSKWPSLVVLCCTVSFAAPPHQNCYPPDGQDEVGPSRGRTCVELTHSGGPTVYSLYGKADFEGSVDDLPNETTFSFGSRLKVTKPYGNGAGTYAELPSAGGGDSENFFVVTLAPGQYSSWTLDTVPNPTTPHTGLYIGKASLRSRVYAEGDAQDFWDWEPEPSGSENETVGGGLPPNDGPIFAEDPIFGENPIVAGGP